MGSKTAAREAAIRAGVAGRPGHRRAARRCGDGRGERTRLRRAVGYPLLVKAVAGGGGKGMRTVDDAGGALGGDPDRAFRSRFGVRRLRRLSRAAHPPSAAHRDPAARRHARHRSSRSSSASVRSSGAIRRWSKSRRRSRCRRSCAARMADGGGGGRPCGRLHQRRHDRVPARRERRRSTSSR